MNKSGAALKIFTLHCEKYIVFKPLSPPYPLGLCMVLVGGVWNVRGDYIYQWKIVGKKEKVTWHLSFSIALFLPLYSFSLPLPLLPPLSLAPPSLSLLSLCLSIFLSLSLSLVDNFYHYRFFDLSKIVVSSPQKCIKVIWGQTYEPLLRLNPYK